MTETTYVRADAKTAGQTDTSHVSGVSFEFRYEDWGRECENRAMRIDGHEWFYIAGAAWKLLDGDRSVAIADEARTGSANAACRDVGEFEFAQFKREKTCNL